MKPINTVGYIDEFATERFAIERNTYARNIDVAVDVIIAKLSRKTCAEFTTISL